MIEYCTNIFNITLIIRWLQIISLQDWTSLGTRHLTFQVLDPTELTWFLETISCQLHTHYIYITFPIFTSNTASLLSICLNAILVALANNEVWSSNLWRHLWSISWALYNSFKALAVTLLFLQLLMALKPLISNPHLALTPENIRPIDRYCMFFSVVICFGFLCYILRLFCLAPTLALHV